MRFLTLLDWLLLQWTVTWPIDQVVHLESEDDGPDQTEGQPRVSVDDVLGADRLEPDLEKKSQRRQDGQK